MKYLFLAAFSLFAISVTAQTKEIAFKSHSGSKSNYAIAIEKGFFGVEEANFGLPSTISSYELDSVIYISPGKTLLIRRQFQRDAGAPLDSARFVRNRRDTVCNDPIFSRNHALDSIRSVIKKREEYTNPVKKIVFIGYDNAKAKNKKKEKSDDMADSKQNNLLPLAINNDHGNHNNSTPYDSQWILMVGIIVALSLTGGWLSWKFYQPRLQNA